MRTANCRLALLLPVALLLACGPDSDDFVFELQAHSFKNSEWSAPANLGPMINTTNAEASATLSPDGLSLYFSSDRPGGLGGTDIWVSHRACAECPWSMPINVGVLNSVAAESAPSLSVDGHLLFFLSGRPGGLGGNDIYL